MTLLKTYLHRWENILTENPLIVFPVLPLKKALCQLGNAFLAVIQRNSAVVWLRVSIK